MTGSAFQSALIAILAFAVVIVVLSVYIRRRKETAESRMRSMMQVAGLDPDIDPIGDHDEVIQAIRRRCRRCRATGECETWLEGDHADDNDFCPNARVFEILAKYKNE